MSARPMPDRATATAAIVAEHDELFALGEDGRRELLSWICEGLNVIDGGAWGLLEKPGGRIPADIIVWADTLDHVDVLTDSAATWIPKGPIQPDWAWIVAPPPGDQPEPPEPPQPPQDGAQPYPGDAWVTAYQTQINAAYAAAGQPPPCAADSTVWMARTLYDIGAGLTKEASAAKHLAELNQALGLA